MKMFYKIPSILDGRKGFIFSISKKSIMWYPEKMYKWINDKAKYQKFTYFLGITLYSIKGYEGGEA